MFSGEEQAVKLLVRNHLAGVIIDRFGTNIQMTPQNDEYFTVLVRVHASEKFLGWVMSMAMSLR